MHWSTITTGIGNTAIDLFNDGQRMLTLAYRGKSDTVYLNTKDGDRRLFYYRKRGWFHKKLVLENEYGANLGELQKEGKNEYIVVDNKRYFISYKTQKEVELLETTTNQPVFVCSLDYDNPNPNISYSLLMILCVYLF